MPEAIGVDLGGTKMAVGVASSRGELLYRATERSYGRTADELLAAIELELRRALDAHPKAVAAGLGLPCTIDRARGVAVNAVNLPITNLPVRDLMRERVGIPVFVDNDANLALLGEHLHGAARGSRHAVMLTVGTGIGGGILIDGELYRGATGAGAELGHMVVDMDGPPCQGSCPSRGCVEAVASGTALAREGHAVDGKAVADAAIAGDADARRALAAIGRRLGVGLASLANIFEPEVILIGGGVSAAGDLLIEPAREEMRSRALPPQNGTPVLAAELGTDAGLLGAAAMALGELAAGGSADLDSEG